MALQSSGAISISQIKAEVGSTSNSLRTLSAAAGFVVPDAMSEFYGYSAYSNAQFYRNDGVNDYLEYSGGSGSLVFGQTPLTVSFWVRQNSSTHKNAQLLNFSPAFSKDNRIMIDYNTSSSKLRFNHRANAQNCMTEYYLAAASNTGATGVRSAWTSSDRGNVNGNGFVMLTYTYNPSSAGLDGLTVYWNDQPLTVDAFTEGNRGNLAVVNARVGENIHTTASAGCANMDFDEIKIFTKVLSATEVTQLYNNGTSASNSQIGISDLLTEIDYEGGLSDSSSYFSTATAYNGGALTGY